MRRKISIGVAILFLFSLAVAGCVLKNAKGEEVFRLDLGGDKEKKGDDKSKEDREREEKEKAEAEEAIRKAITKVEDAKETQKTSKPHASEKKAENPARSPADTSESPWWAVAPVKKSGIRESSIQDGAKDNRNEPADAMVKNGGESEPSDVRQGDLSDNSSPEEPMPPEPAPSPAPVKRTVQVDKHLAQVPSKQWSEVYAQQTSQKASSNRRASMEQVKQGIEAGYGSVYVAKMEKAISVDANNGYAYYFLARGRFENGDWKGAKGFADSAVQKLGNDVKFRAAARVMLSKTLANSGNLEEAAKQAKEAVNDDTENTEARILVLRYGQE
jgi:hypothetical protein